MHDTPRVSPEDVLPGKGCHHLGPEGDSHLGHEIEAPEGSGRGPIIPLDFHRLLLALFVQKTSLLLERPLLHNRDVHHGGGRGLLSGNTETLLHEGGQVVEILGQDRVLVPLSIHKIVRVVHGEQQRHTQGRKLPNLLDPTEAINQFSDGTEASTTLGDPGGQDGAREEALEKRRHLAKHPTQERKQVLEEGGHSTEDVPKDVSKGIEYQLEPIGVNNTHEHRQDSENDKRKKALPIPPELDHACRQGGADKGDRAVPEQTEPGSERKTVQHDTPGPVKNKLVLLFVDEVLKVLRLVVFHHALNIFHHGIALGDITSRELLEDILQLTINLIMNADLAINHISRLLLKTRVEGCRGGIDRHHRPQSEVIAGAREV